MQKMKNIEYCQIDRDINRIYCKSSKYKNQFVFEFSSNFSNN